MRKETISVKQATLLIILFIMGNSLVLPTAIEAGQDLWIAIIASIFMALPVILMVARLHKLFPGKDLFLMADLIFGRVIGQIITVIMIWFSLTLAALVLRSFGEFIVISDLTETPKMIPMVALLALCIWGAKEGQEVLGRWSELFGIATILLIVTTLVLLLPDSRVSNLLPMFYSGYRPVLRGAFSVFAFPLAEVIIFLMIFSSFEKNKPYQVYTLGLVIGWFIILIASLSELSIIGIHIYENSYFPSNTSVARLNVGNFLQRLEIIPAVTLLVGGFIKISVCLIAASRGFAHLIGSKDYRFIVIPTGLLTINFANWVFEHPFKMFEGMILWKYYAFPFQVILPLTLWIGAELYQRRQRRKDRGEE